MNQYELFYQYPYDKNFVAKVVRCTTYNDGYAIVLDDTLFYPEGGGQPGDTGVIDGIRVKDTIRDADEVILHLVDEPIEEGKVIHGTIDWDRRYDHMQGHTAEHVLSGIVHHTYGYNNVGFHMGETIQVDFDGPLDKQQIDALEKAVNDFIITNAPVRVFYPRPDELEKMTYRSKKELEGLVRIIRIDHCDSCACCGMHVNYTGEIGLVKILSFEKHKEGVRIHFLAGKRAVAFVNRIYEQNLAISRMLCAKVEETDKAVERLLTKGAEMEKEVSMWKKQVLDGVVERTAEGEKLAVVFLKGCERKDITHVADRLVHERKCGCAAVMNAEENGMVSYVIMSQIISLKQVVKAINEKLHGRGGGKDTIIQGSFQSDEETIRNVLEELLHGIL